MNTHFTPAHVYDLMTPLNPNKEPKIMHTKHTPGPWHVKGGTPLVGIDRPYDIIAGASLIAQTLIAPERSAAAANAALIAAAPEMLAALIDLMAIIDSPQISIYGVVDQQWTVAKRETRAAITRATGAA